MWKHVDYSIINLVGLTLGMATCIVILLYVRYEMSWDTNHKNADRIYRVQQQVTFQNDHEIYTRTGFALSKELVNKFPEFEAATVIKETPDEYLSTSNELTFYEKFGYYAQNSIFDVFTYTFIQGNPNDALTEPSSVVLTKEMAQKYFPKQQAFGKFIKASQNRLLKVTGIIENPPFNQNYRPDYLVSMSTYEAITTWKDYAETKNIASTAFNTFVLLRAGISRQLVNEKIAGFMNAYSEENFHKSLYLKPISEIHVSPREVNDIKLAFYYLGGISIFVLLLACVNFINLATANSNFRKKEIGIRKVIGGNKSSLFIQFVGESLFFSLASIICAFVLAEILLPYFNNIVQRPLAIHYITDIKFLALLFTLFIITGLLAGIYPALYLSSLQPVEVIKGNLTSAFTRKNTNSKSFTRKMLVTFQFVISLTIVIATIFVSKQIAYIENKDLGFNKHDLMICTNPGVNSGAYFDNLKTELLQRPDIVNITKSINAPFNGTYDREINWEGSSPDDKINALYNEVDYDFIDTYQMQIVKGRNFSRQHSTDQTACLINETAMKLFGWDDAIGKKIDNLQYTVVGVVKDFNPFAATRAIPPYFMVLDADNSQQHIYSIRTQGANRQAITAHVTSTFQKIYPDAIIDVRYFTENIEYGAEDLWKVVGKIFFAFSIIAVLLAANGLYGLISFAVQRRVKEIGIRKILGANSSHLYFIISKEFLGLMLLAMCIACPLGYLLSTTSPSAYKYSMQPQDYIWGMCVLVATSIIATCYHTTRAILTNPVETLKVE